MLIKVFGIWLIASNITNLAPDRNKCVVAMIKSYTVYIDSMVKFDRNCDEVAEEINKQIKAAK